MRGGPVEYTDWAQALKDSGIRLTEIWRERKGEMDTCYLLVDGEPVLVVVDAKILASPSVVSKPQPPQPPMSTATSPPAPRVSGSPILDAAGLDRLPWTPFKSGKGWWIHADEEDAVELRMALDKAADKKTGIVVNAYRYVISHGETSEFINRFTHNGGSSK